MTLMKLARAGRRQPIFELWSIIIGAPPPVLGVHHRNKPLEGELTCLAEAHALFQGIERPFADDDRGENVLSYVLKRRFSYENDPDMVSVACKVSVSDDLVFVAHVRPEPNGGQFTGTVTHWEFAESDQRTFGCRCNLVLATATGYGRRYA